MDIKDAAGHELLDELAQRALTAENRRRAVIIAMVNTDWEIWNSVPDTNQAIYALAGSMIEAANGLIVGGKALLRQVPTNRE